MPNEPKPLTASLRVYLWSQVSIRFTLLSNGRSVSTMPFDHAAVTLTSQDGRMSQFFTIDPIQFVPVVFTGTPPINYTIMRTILGSPTVRFSCTASRKEVLDPFSDAMTAINAWGTGDTASYGTDSTLMALWVAMKFYGSRASSFADCAKAVRNVKFPLNQVQRTSLIRPVPGSTIVPYGERRGRDGTLVTISRQISDAGSRANFPTFQTTAVSVIDAFDQGISLKGNRNGRAPERY